MVIKSFLFLLVASIFVLSGCESLERRKGIKPVTSGGSAPHEPLYTQVPNHEVQTVPTVPAIPTVPVVAVGVFLGPGAMRTFAHIGVLRVLQQAHIPIVAIGGMEWGSLVAASFALSNKPNEVEWEMMKLKQEHLPTTSLLHRELYSAEPDRLAPFLKSAFGEKELDREMAFRCPYTDGDQVFFVSRGLAREQLLKCMAMPPLFSSVEKDGKNWIAGAVNPGDWSGELRRAGAQYLIYVDVISRGPIIHSSTKYTNPDQLRSLWAAIKTLSRQQHAFANLTIEVPMDFDLSDFNRRKEAMTMGEEAAKTYLSQTLKAIGMEIR